MLGEPGAISLLQSTMDPGVRDYGQRAGGVNAAIDYSSQGCWSE